MTRAGLRSWLAPFLGAADRAARTGASCVAMILAAIFAAVLAPYDPLAIDPIIRL